MVYFSIITIFFPHVLPIMQTVLISTHNFPPPPDLAPAPSPAQTSPSHSPRPKNFQHSSTLLLHVQHILFTITIFQETQSFYNRTHVHSLRIASSHRHPKRPRRFPKIKENPTLSRVFSTSIIKINSDYLFGVSIGTEFAKIKTVAFNHGVIFKSASDSISTSCLTICDRHGR